MASGTDDRKGALNDRTPWGWSKVRSGMMNSLAFFSLLGCGCSHRTGVVCTQQRSSERRTIGRTSS